ncbi:RHS repeat-associated core domain-containing protein [Pseudoalteromonas sp.]|uniref:RHS repeat-associated core domain-containing protein n=1 Tax=Pseudoalteromonas sp. TaxID=53249 RepID=UPI00257BD1BF|nr:RHS repeat-associated core domain-containing protein [Pseudoalteromonas sp.]
MNGRVYDYNLGRFMSVDPVIQFVGNSQGINPYSYIMNNPMAGTDPTGYVIDTIWDVGNVIFDVGKVAYGAATGNDDMVTEGLTDLAIDAAATLIPFVPAGASKAARTGAEKVADARQASKKADTTPSTQKSESNANSDGGTKTTNGADSTQSANSANQKTTDIGSQESISSTKELRGGDFNKGKAEAQQRSGGNCEYCGAGNAKEGDHFIPLNEGKKQVNAGQMTKAEAKQTLNKPDNIVNSCTSCNRGAVGKGTKMPSSSPGEGKWVTPDPCAHVKDKLDKL